jgi:hypothetical protein
MLNSLVLQATVARLGADISTGLEKRRRAPARSDQLKQIFGTLPPRESVGGDARSSREIALDAGSL